jgi:hypothetical protein
MANVPVVISRTIIERPNGLVSSPPATDFTPNPLNPDGISQIPPVHLAYTSEANMIAGQSNQIANFIYFDGSFYWEYLGTTDGDIDDYRIWTGGFVEWVERENNTVLFDKKYIIGNAAARTGNILFDFTGAKLGAETEMRHADASAFTFPAEAKLMFDSADISTTDDNFFLFVLTKKSSTEIVKVFHAIEGGV